MKVTTKSLFFLLFLIAISIQSTFLAAQSTWVRTYGGSGHDAAHDIKQTSDGGYIVAGFKDLSSNQSDLWLLKLDSAGIVQWQKTFGPAYEVASSIQQTTDGGYVLAGTTDSYGAGLSDFWVLKLDSSGNVLWENTYGGNSFDGLESIQQTSDDGYIVAGYSQSFAPGPIDGWLLKLNSTGAVQWQKIFGGVDFEWFNSVKETSDGGFIVGGLIFLGGLSSSDLWVLKLDASGNIQWQKSYDRAVNDSLQSVQPTSDGGFVIGASAFNDTWLLKLDSFGSIQWEKQYSTSDFELIYFLHQTLDSGYLLAARKGGLGVADSLILKLDSSGNIQWQKIYGGSNDDFFSAISDTPDGGYIVAGSTFSFGAGSSDWWILKMDSVGNIDSGCNFINSGSATVSDNSTIVQDVLFPSSSTAITPIASNAIVSNTAAVVIEQCGNEPPDAQDDVAITSEDVSVTIDALANDIDPDNDPLTITAFTQGSNGTVTDNGDGTVTYSPDAGFNGSDSFSYVLYDGMVSDVAVVNVIVTAGNDPPVAVDDTATTSEDTPVVVDVLANDSDPDGSPIGVIAVTQGSNGAVTNNGDGTVTYNPNLGFSGSDSFIYTISDGQFTDTASVNVTITAVNNCLFCDDFEDGVLDANWSYEKNILPWSESGGNLIASTSGKSTATAGPVFSGCTNCSVTATMQTAGGFANRVWLLHHFVDKSNFVELLMKEESDRWVLKLRQNKKIIAKGKVLRTIDPNVIYVAMIVYDGTRYQAFVDGELVIALDAEAPVTGGTVGFKVKRTTGTFGSIEVYP